MGRRRYPNHYSYRLRIRGRFVSGSARDLYRLAPEYYYVRKGKY